MAIQMQTVEKAPPREPGKKKDWVPIAAVAGGGLLLAGGLYLALRKAGVTPGSTFTTHVEFDYYGQAGIYTVQVRLGWMVTPPPLPWFTPTAGMKWSVDLDLPGPDAYETDVECLIPEGASAGTLDGEVQIKLPSMEESEYIIRELYDNVIKVAKAD